MIAIINTGCANINSVRFAFERLGVTPEIVSNPEQLNGFDRAILPGVGHANVAMKRLIEQGWKEAIAQYERPLLGICLGMQLLCDYSEEGQINGLGMISGQITQLQTGKLTSPHMGWNTIQPIGKHPLLKHIDENEQVYFVHSFAHTVNESTLAQCEYGQAFSAIVAKDNYAGMQFHPEKSAKVGAKLLNNFMQWQV
ncbi:imidazole glycerol phosphate synthase subunit HisH [Pseudoalteromonas luteoviolacea]|uniref:imidazole glycerol phosphate synthase subunit HisH n=1 Tax=Pseudoalteromonas luteoviolacea TaxID=43657 RepID=UPI001B38C8F7|nr:imidazole glycerol phosphate synthase subunit HisH [Pseudoalteromonas luteoviolacea]MBQ4810636.1 imidazole glycerol phosphate synthase subunit HisH [Pseudoalteromonas luteoviolacea]